MNMAALPLSGITVLDLSRVLSGPFCTMQLADMGARVIKVEQPGRGDDTRAWGPPFRGGESAYYLSINRNKESLALDLKHPGAQEVMTGLLERSDVLVENWGLGPTYAVRTPDWEYIHNDTEELELYDMNADPWQLQSLHRKVDPSVLASFEQKVPHVNPVDGKSMNRFYPGKADGTQTERASFLMTKEVVDQCDHLIDLHGGDLDENLRPYSYWTVTGNKKQDDDSKAMVLAFGLDHIIVSTDRPKDPAASRYLENTATTRGKPSITAEAGYAGTVMPGFTMEKLASLYPMRQQQSWNLIYLKPASPKKFMLRLSHFQQN